MKRVIIAILIVFLIFGVAACSVSKGNSDFSSVQNIYDKFSLDDISELKVVNGTTGDRLNVVNSELITEIFDAFCKLSIKDTKQPKEESGGYTYTISFYNAEDKVLGIVYSGAADTLFINGHLYIVEDMSVIQSSIDYLNEYFEK